MPARSFFAQAQNSLSTPSSTLLLISSPRSGIDKIYNLPCNLTLDFERPTLYPSVTMTNPIHQLPSYASASIAKANSGYFCLPTGCTPAEIECNQGFVKEANRGEEGSKQFTSKYTTSTEALKPGFGESKHFIKKSKGVKEADSGHTNNTYISFVATWPRWIPLSIVLFHLTSKMSLGIGSYAMLIRLTLE